MGSEMGAVLRCSCRVQASLPMIVIVYWSEDEQVTFEKVLHMILIS